MLVSYLIIQADSNILQMFFWFLEKCLNFSMLECFHKQGNIVLQVNKRAFLWKFALKYFEDNFSFAASKAAVTELIVMVPFIISFHVFHLGRCSSCATHRSKDKGTVTQSQVWPAICTYSKYSQIYSALQIGYGPSHYPDLSHKWFFFHSFESIK